MRILPIDEARRISSGRYEANKHEWKENITDRIATIMSAAITDGKFRCKVDFTSYIQDEAFYEALDEVTNSLEQQGYDVCYTISDKEVDEICICENIRISWY